MRKTQCVNKPELYPAMRSTFLRIILLVGILLQAISSAHAEDETTLVPLDEVEAPARDLLYQGKPIDQDEAVTLRKQGVDLSTLEPVPNDMYGLPPQFSEQPLPEEGATLKYDSSLAGFGHEISIHRVTAGVFAYRLNVSTVPHRALLTRALLNRLGFNQYAPRRYKRLKIRFNSIAERKSFLDAVSLETVKDPLTTWVKDLPDNLPEVTLQDVVLEPGRVEVQNYYWAILPSNFSEGRRALRSLLVPISLCDAPENLDSYHWDFTRILNNSLLIPYPKEIENQRPFDQTTIDDIRWSARKIAAFSREDWRSIVAQAGYPEDLAALVLEKIIAKRNQLLTSIGIEAEALPYDARLSNGSVKVGEVMVASFDGYASRFSYGDAEDPMSLSEMGDLGVMQIISSGMQTLATKLNTMMVVADTTPYLQAHIQKMSEAFFTHMIQHPNEPYSQPISSWGGPVGGFNLTANRQVSTGSYYGSNAPIQLVDSVGFSGSLGYFRGIDGIKNVTPGFQANVTLSRSYTHVRSMPTISKALRVPAKDFVVPYLLYDLSTILKQPKADATAGDKEKALATYTKAIEDLLSKIHDGEMFTITDTLAGGLSANVHVPVQAFFPSVPVGYNQGLSFGGQVQGMILKRTTLRRVKDETTGDNYLQIYVQSLNSVTGNLTVDFNYWLKIAHFGLGTSAGVARTRVYTVKSDSARPEATAVSLSGSLRWLLQTNLDSRLKANYPFYLLQHDLSEDESQFRFLFYHSKKLEEQHRLRIQPPKDPDHPFVPKDFERTLFSHRKLARSGSNYFWFISDIVNSATQGSIEFSTSSGDNPAYSIFGDGHWFETYSDAEITQGSDYTFRPVTIARETWAGWSISHKSLFEIFDQIDSKLKDLREFGLKVSPIHRDVFVATEALEFYNITSTTIFYSKGIDRIVTALTGDDKQVIDSLRSWLRAENEDADICSRPPVSNHRVIPPTYYHGKYYKCLDPWIKSVLKLVSTKPKEAPETREAIITWQTELISLLQKKLPYSQLLKVAQKDGFYLQIQVNGFRKGDHEARDSEQKEVVASYLSDTVGTADQFAGAGAFNFLAQDTKITPYELNALFFSGGN